MKDFLAVFGAGLLTVVMLVLSIACYLAPAVSIIFMILKLCGVMQIGWFFVVLPTLAAAVVLTILIIIKALIG